MAAERVAMHAEGSRRSGLVAVVVCEDDLNEAFPELAHGFAVGAAALGHLFNQGLELGSQGLHNRFPLYAP